MPRRFLNPLKFETPSLEWGLLGVALFHWGYLWIRGEIAFSEQTHLVCSMRVHQERLPFVITGTPWQWVRLQRPLPIVCLKFPSLGSEVRQWDNYLSLISLEPLERFITLLRMQLLIKTTKQKLAWCSQNHSLHLRTPKMAQPHAGLARTPQGSQGLYLHLPVNQHPSHSVSSPTKALQHLEFLACSY